MSYEYKVVPAPVRGLKAKGLKTTEDRFAHALETTMNELAAGGWEYVRADTLPCEQREGIMSKTTVFQNMLVFRREKKAAVAAPVVRAEPQVSPQPLKTGQERLAERGLLAPTVAPTSTKEPEVGRTSKDDKKPSPDLAAE
jgi:hypothetical protein